MKKRKLLISIFAGFMAFVMLMGLVVSLIPRASALSSGEIRDQIDELQEKSEEYAAQREELEGQLASNYEDIKGIVGEKENIENQINLIYKEIDNLNELISAYNTLIADKQVELDAAQQRFDDLNAKNKERVRAMEEEGNLSYWSVLFKANSFSDFLDRLNMVQEIAAADNRRIRELGEAADEVAEAKQSLAAEKSSLEGSKQQLKDSESLLEEKKIEAQNMLDLLLQREAEYVAHLQEVEEADAALIDEIGALEYEYYLAKQREWEEYMATMTTAPTQPDSETGGSSEGEGGETSDPPYSPPSEEGWIAPCYYVMVTDPYGWRIHPIGGYESFHSGVDLAAAEGTPIYAARSGYVTTSTYHWSFGNYVTINHEDGYASMYAHMMYSVVSDGEYVSQGQLIGYMGSTGESTGPHLHFVIYYNGATVNPMAYI